MAWLQYTIKLPKAKTSTCVHFFESTHALAITLQDAQNNPIFEPPPGTILLWPDTEVTALYEAQIDKAALEAQFKQFFSPEDFETLVCKWIADEDWQKRCLDQFQPMSFGQRLWVYPSWHINGQLPSCAVQLDPGVCFGTGNHPTTKLCLEWLDQNIQSQGTLIDYGSGSGILGIAAIKLGVKKVYAVDIDEQAIESTLNNARHNQISTTQLNGYLPQALPDIQTDILIANILCEPLLQLKDTFYHHVKTGGHLVLSGLLKEQIPHIISCYGKELKKTTEQYWEDWGLIAFAK